MSLSTEGNLLIHALASYKSYTGPACSPCLLKAAESPALAALNALNVPQPIWLQDAQHAPPSHPPVFLVIKVLKVTCDHMNVGFVMSGNRITAI